MRSGHRGRRYASWSAVSVLLILVASACLPIGIAEDYQVAMVRIYNRTLSVISYDGGWAPICSMSGHLGLPPWPSPAVSAPPGAVPVTFDLDVPADFKGVMSVVVSDTGVTVSRGEVEEGSLPACAGLPHANGSVPPR